MLKRFLERIVREMVIKHLADEASYTQHVADNIRWAKDSRTGGSTVAGRGARFWLGREDRSPRGVRQLAGTGVPQRVHREGCHHRIGGRAAGMRERTAEAAHPGEQG